MNASLSNTWQYREAIYNLALLRLRIRYSNSVLGFLWTLGNPLFFMIIFSFVFTVLFSNGIENYPVFILSAMLPWNFFNAAVLGATSSVSGAREMLNKLAFPREILPFSSVLAEFVNFLADRFGRQHAAVDDQVFLFNMNRIFFLEVFLRDIRGRSTQAMFPFFPQGSDPKPEFAHWPGGREGQQVIASIGVE